MFWYVNIKNKKNREKIYYFNIFLIKNIIHGVIKHTISFL
jgi:hypothetical protein